MKLLIFVAVFATVFVAVRGTISMENLTTGLSRMFEIKEEDVEKCINKTAATEDDFRVLEDAITDPEVFESEKVPESQREQVRKSVRRFMCALTCCAQKQGTMIGSQIQVAVIHDKIKTWPVPKEIKPVLTVAVTECGEEVKDVTEECEATYGFANCVVEKLKHNGVWPESEEEPEPQPLRTFNFI